jgi:hypothetical protein
MEKWKKLKHIFSPDNNFEWMVSHAATPFAKHLIDDIFRIYFTCRNKSSESHIGYVDVDFNNDFKVVGVSDTPVLTPGENGIYDDSGAGMSYIININGKEHLYYIAWNLKVKVPWLNTIGLAIWNEEKQAFIKPSRVPVLDRSDEDPFTVSYPCVIHDNGIYKMWYGSNLTWGNGQKEQMDHVIKYAESTDGINWKRSYDVAIPLTHKNEYAISRPCIRKAADDSYEMWYSYRGNGDITTYRIGYATSPDGLSWTRKDNEAGINISNEGWDSQMVCYPFVFEHKGKKYLIYNGNDYGKTGFGIAEYIK